MYETGVLVAFLMWVYSTIMLIVNANSRLARNLAKVDMRLSWYSGEPVPASDRSGAAWRVLAAFILVCLGLVGILLSWASVAWTVGTIIYQRSKQSGMPQPVKELRWKLRNMDMTREQILAEINAAHAATSVTSAAPT